MKKINEMSMKELLHIATEKRIRVNEEKRKRKNCTICGKDHKNRENTCSDECHDLFKQILIKQFGEYKIVVDSTTGKKYRVPIVDIVEKGIGEDDLKKYPELEEEKMKNCTNCKKFKEFTCSVYTTGDSPESDRRRDGSGIIPPEKFVCGAGELFEKCIKKDKEGEGLQIKKYQQLLTIKEIIEKGRIDKIHYHGLKDPSPCGDYPLFVQWGHKYPIIGINHLDYLYHSELLPMPEEIGYAIEKILGNVKDEEDYQKQIDNYFQKMEISCER